MEELNSFHEWVEEVRGEEGKFSSTEAYEADTYNDMEAVREGYTTDGTMCYERFIPADCWEVVAAE